MEYTVENERWITIKPHGEDSDDYRRIKLEDGETPKEAIDRIYGNDGQLALGFKGAKKAQKDAKAYENKKAASVDKLYKSYVSEDTKDYGKNVTEALKEYAQYHDKALSFDDLEEFAENYEDKQFKARREADYKQYIKEQEAKRAEEKAKEKPKDENPRATERHKFQEAKTKHEKIYSDFEKGIGTFADLEQADKDYKAAYDKYWKPEEKVKEEPKAQELSKREIYQNAAKALRDAEKATRSAQTVSEIIELAKVEKEAKTALTKARTEFAESLMDEFEETDSSSYDDKLQARKDRYTELSEKAAKESAAAAQKSRDMISAIPMGQPILVGHYSEKRDRAYRERAWDKLGQSVKLADKANYYEGKADSVGKAGISSDDPNAIAKLGQKYKALKRQQAMMKDANKIIRSKADDAEKIKKLQEIGVSDEVAHKLVTPDFMGRTGYADYKLTGNTAEMRRIIDRVLEIDKNKERAAETPKSEDYSKYGFKVERNTDINRLQLKFDGKPDEKTRTLLKSSGFRWSPRESAWQRQLTGNAEYSLKNIVKKLEVNNEKEQDMALIEELKKLIMNVENDRGDDYMVENAKEDKRKLIDEVGGILKDKVDEEVWRTVVGKLEKIAYEKSEAGTADNACKKDVKNEEEEPAEDKKEVKKVEKDVEEDVEDNNVENAKDDYFQKVMDVYNAANKAAEEKTYQSREDKLDAAKEYFS